MPVDPALALRLAGAAKAGAGASLGAASIQPPGALGQAQAPVSSNFQSLLSEAAQTTLSEGKAAEQLALNGLQGNVSLREVAEAVTQAELGLQTATAVRDRVIAAYQEIIRMPI